ncbi:MULTISPECIES: TetR/AcrR family transcriptional regulator [unclassified Rhizobium]|uniref:TetR/AcrR family transcriptional regulator n=1 Tax=unclassified Rhizobium TaxID=2613769 RepID=UPI00160BC779|nr:MULTISPECIES: TetR/AcrR family transcriptional regulator [unclassified Rhizobium]MBB3318374.1 AcrR family transcriptional regulator [Rhizobium sp. BK181]MBB3539325.1 AcrR family transcriptional regulator [Rhizobium sp. BK399]MCS3741285.1 AcrR family transcriptional regulator [Rhizobium sp. BK661]MCS4093449.1 AcrR family transcriptional regulator [Rhizobium sp. BK176]
MTSLPKPLAKPRKSTGARRNPEAEAAVLAAAREVISEKGYIGFSVEEVARRAGSGKTTIYRWYPTKADLFIAIYTAERHLSVPVPDTGDLLDDLEQYTVSLWRFWASHPAGAALKSLIAEAQGASEALDALRERFLPARTADVRQMLKRGAERGQVRAEDVDDKVTLWVGLSWFKLLVNELDQELSVRRLMAHIAGIPPAP